MPVLLRLLLIEGNGADARRLEERVCESARPWCTVSHASSLTEALDRVRGEAVDAVLLALPLPDGKEGNAVSLLREAAPHMPMVVLVGLNDEQMALQAVAEGAEDHLLKDQITPPLLARAVRYAIQKRRADASERRESAAARTAQQREQFVGVLGHDLRNPLSSIAISAGLLMKNPDLTERQLRTVTRIANSAERMNRMIRDLLDLTRSRLGDGYGLSRRAASLRDILRQVVEELEIVHPRRALIVSAEQTCSGQWDTDRMAQVVSNLISNGLQHSPEETPLRIALWEEDREDGSDAILEVTNQGSPISPDQLADTFEPFARVQAIPSGGVPQGLGLGLYIAQQIVLAHQGRIDVRSVAGEGTTFSVRVPQTHSPAAT